ncbi:hypothetical protein L7F22_027346 [Adiantum nelumboides]|nr:hypothetical protein [Adiantum nelumboides]
MALMMMMMINREDPPKGPGPSSRGAAIEPANPPNSQPEPPPPTPKGGIQEEIGIVGHGGGSQEEMGIARQEFAMQLGNVSTIGQGSKALVTLRREILDNGTLEVSRKRQRFRRFGGVREKKRDMLTVEKMGKASSELQRFVLRSHALRVYRSALRTARRAPFHARGIHNASVCATLLSMKGSVCQKLDDRDFLSEVYTVGDFDCGGSHWIRDLSAASCPNTSQKCSQTIGHYSQCIWHPYGYKTVNFRLLYFLLPDTQGELCEEPIHVVQEEKISNLDTPDFEDLDEQRYVPEDLHADDLEGVQAPTLSRLCDANLKVVQDACLLKQAYAEDNPQVVRAKCEVVDCIQSSMEATRSMEEATTTFTDPCMPMHESLLIGLGMDAYDFIFWQEEKGYDFGSSCLEGLSGYVQSLNAITNCICYDDSMECEIDAIFTLHAEFYDVEVQRYLMKSNQLDEQKPIQDVFQEVFFAHST